MTSEVGLEAAVARLRETLPGWWWRVGSCSVSSDASIGPDVAGPDSALLAHKTFDEGFHVDLAVGTVSDALSEAMREGLAAKAANQGRRGDPESEPEPSYREYAFSYRNWRNVVADRVVRVLGMRFGTSEYHKRPGPLLVAIDVKTGHRREFSAYDMGPTGRIPPNGRAWREVLRDAVSEHDSTSGEVVEEGSEHWSVRAKAILEELDVFEAPEGTSAHDASSQ